MSECMSDLPRYLHRSAPCAYSKYAVFVYSRAETTGLPAGGLWITTNCHSYRQAYWYAQEYGCKHVFYQPYRLIARFALSRLLALGDDRRAARQNTRDAIYKIVTPPGPPGPPHPHTSTPKRAQARNPTLYLLAVIPRVAHITIARQLPRWCFHRRWSPARAVRVTPLLRAALGPLCRALDCRP